MSAPKQTEFYDKRLVPDDAWRWNSGEYEKCEAIKGRRLVPYNGLGREFGKTHPRDKIETVYCSKPATVARNGILMCVECEERIREEL